MEYQKITNFLIIQRINHLNLEQNIWVEINDKSQGKYDNSSIKFKTSMIRSDLYDYSDGYIFFSGTITS